MGESLVEKDEKPALFDHIFGSQGSANVIATFAIYADLAVQAQLDRQGFTWLHVRWPALVYLPPRLPDLMLAILYSGLLSRTSLSKSR